MKYAAALLAVAAFAGCGAGGQVHTPQEVKRAFAAHGERLGGAMWSENNAGASGMLALLGPIDEGPSAGFFVVVYASGERADRALARKDPRRTLRYLHRDNVVLAYSRDLPRAAVARYQAALDDLP